jgi:superfamily I DNA/RNA helicase
MPIEPTPEQQAVIDHDWTQHDRVLAGPGTGKSATAVALAERLSESEPGLRLRFLTFTRAATGELAKKLLDSLMGATAFTETARFEAGPSRPRGEIKLGPKCFLPARDESAQRSAPAR